MHYHKSVELAEIYGVSRRTVTNWIEQTKQGRLDLDLYKHKEIDHIAKTPKNQMILKDLVHDRRKFLNRKSLKFVTPLPQFYTLYSEAQILDIIYNIETNREIPRQYNYFDDGAKLWDNYVQQFHVGDTPSMVIELVNLFNANIAYLDKLLARYSHVNVVDVGVGNALPVKELLDYLLAKKKLKRYIAIDISKEMLAVAEKNIINWFNEEVRFEGYQRDISFERFADVIAEPPVDGADATVNLVLLLGGTSTNFKAPEDVLKVIGRSMQHNDIFVTTTLLDTLAMRERFNITMSESQPLPPQHRFIVDRLNLDDSYYDAEVGFDQVRHERFLRVRMKHAVSIEFKLSKGVWRVDLGKGEALLLCRSRSDNYFDIARQIYNSGFNLLLSNQTTAHDYLLVVADLRKDER